MKKPEKKHHFLYYIFQFDKETCMMDEKPRNFLQKLLHLFRKGI